MTEDLSSRDLIRLLEADGWRAWKTVGDHHQFKHVTKPGKVTVTHPVKSIPIGTLRSIDRQAGWIGERSWAMRVVAVIHRDEGTGYGVSFPDFPGCVSGGDSLDAVLARGTEALNAHVAWMLEEGDPIPAARDLDDLRQDPEFAVDFEGAVVATVPTFIPGRRARRVNVTIDGDLLEEIDAAAKTFPGGRSGFLAQAAREKIIGAR